MLHIIKPNLYFLLPDCIAYFVRNYNFYINYVSSSSPGASLSGLEIKKCVGILCYSNIHLFLQENYKYDDGYNKQVNYLIHPLTPLDHKD